MGRDESKLAYWSGHRYRYDLAGNCISERSIEHQLYTDSNGTWQVRVGETTTTHYTYDARGQRIDTETPQAEDR